MAALGQKLTAQQKRNISRGQKRRWDRLNREALRAARENNVIQLFKSETKRHTKRDSRITIYHVDAAFSKAIHTLIRYLGNKR